MFDWEWEDADIDPLWELEMNIDFVLDEVASYESAISILSDDESELVAQMRRTVDSLNELLGRYCREYGEMSRSYIGSVQSVFDGS